MQMRFAVIKMYNAELGKHAHYGVACMGHRWFGVQLSATQIRYLTLRDGASDERLLHMVDGAPGTVSNADKPFVEIAMLLKRYARPSPGYAGDTAMDWKVKSIDEAPLVQLYNKLRESAYRASAISEFISTSMQVLFTIRPNGRSVGTVRTTRVRQLANNIVARLTGEPHARDGLLRAMPGAWCRRSAIMFDPIYGPANYTAMRDRLRRVGGLLAQCIHASRRGENFEGLYDDLLVLLREHDPWVGQMRSGIAAGLAKIHNNTITLLDCGHFDELSRANTVLTHDGSHAQWCQHCIEHRAAVLADTDVLTDTAAAYWSDQHDAWYSYDIDAEEGYRDSSGRNRAIMDYSHNVLRTLKPDETLISSHYGDFLMGIELEMISGTASREVAAKDVRRQLGSSYCVIKNDGSLPDKGFEIVTAPRGLKEHIERFTGWQINPVYRAWDTGQCGLHVHIHSRAFTEMTLGKLLMFYNANGNAQFIRRLAGRHPLSDTWAQRYCGMEGQEALDNPKAAVKGKSPERYRIVNMQNLTPREAKRLGLKAEYVNGKYDTIELRIFKASLRKERLLAQIEFAHASVMFCRVASYRDLSGPAFLKWLAPQSRVYPNLANWFGMRRSKAVKEAGGKPLEEVCTDRSPNNDLQQFMRAAPARRRRALPAGINSTVLPVVPPRSRRSSSYF